MSLRTLLSSLLGLVLVVGALATGAAADESLNPHRPWNGKKVYLSPARHAPDNVGCLSYGENSGSLTVARAAASSPYRDGAHFPDLLGQGNLRSRGYQVRIGNGTVSTAIANSNAWNATVHVPVHSNARNESCSNSTLSSHGTWVMYVSTGGSSLSSNILSYVGPKSPGTNDITCTDTACAGYSLAELRQTNAVAAYVESEFHTWNQGVNWIRTAQQQWGYRVAAGIDSYLGYPR